jgi:hypothetical protein
MTDKLLFPYEIPNRFFLPHTVIRKFHAKVIYTIKEGKPVIEEVGLSPKCLAFINNTAGMLVSIEVKLNEVVEKINRNSHVDQTVMTEIAPFI